MCLQQELVKKCNEILSELPNGVQIESFIILGRHHDVGSSNRVGKAPRPWKGKSRDIPFHIPDSYLK